ncbi:DUF2017 domain-containing protein [Marisediminicola sp. LYQ85]|uniref:DUF2017 domain-containing protein n=1 Tax=Marisediminicola sp. LYQ85 TaxID=3391062 RepID=UPI0039833D54
MKAFTRADRGLVSAEFEPVEAALLTQLASQVAGVLSTRRDDAAPADPVLARLLPDAYADSDHAAEFRRFTADGLGARKIGNAQRIIADVAECLTAETETAVLLDEAAVGAWLRSLTDIRLMLAVRLGISDSDVDDPAPPSDEMLMLGDIYDWLGWVQDSLVDAVDEP